MTLPAIAPTPTDLPAVRAAWAEYEAAVQEHGPADEWDAKVLDRIIAHLASTGRQFSSNDIRELAPEVRKCLVSRRLIAAQHAGQIRKVGYTPSTLRSTHGHPVAVYRAT